MSNFQISGQLKIKTLAVLAFSFVFISGILAEDPQSSSSTQGKPGEAKIEVKIDAAAIAETPKTASAQEKPASTSTESKKSNDMSLSDALMAFKKESKRMSGFRKKERIEAKNGNSAESQKSSLVEKAALTDKNKHAKRIKSELDALKIDNKRLEDEIMGMIDEDSMPEKEFTEKGLPDIAPNFPGYARLMSKNGYFHAQLTFDSASWAYNDKNKVVDLSQAIVGYAPVKIQDVLLISRLARMSSEKSSAGAWISRGTGYQYLVGDVALSNVSSDIEWKAFNATNTSLTDSLEASKSLKLYNHYLNRIADKQLEFKAETRGLNLLLNFSHALSRNYAVGLQVPIVFRSNKIELISEFTTSELEEIASSDVSKENQSGLFFTRYPSGLKDFFRDVLEKKGLTPRQRHNQLGIGDISLFVNKKINCPEIVTAGVVGLGITFPSGVKTDNSYLWPSQLGNGGFWELRAHSSLFWRNSGFCNPHLFSEIRFKLGSSVERRISRIVDRKKARTRDTDGLKAGDLPLGSGFVFNVEAEDWKETESKVPALADAPMRTVDLNPGLNLKFRAGNLFNGIALAKGYLDVYYQAEFDFEDSIGFRQINPDFDTESLTANTERHSHTIGATYAYKFDDNWSFELGISHVFTGKNTQRSLQITGGALYNF